MHKLLRLEKKYLYNIETIMQNNIHKDPLPGIRIKSPISIPSSSDIIIGYELYVDDSHYMFVKPNPEKMRKKGWVALVCFFPPTCVPCCLGCCYHETYQRPIYGQPSPSIKSPEIAGPSRPDQAPEIILIE